MITKYLGENATDLLRIGGLAGIKSFPAGENIEFVYIHSASPEVSISRYTLAHR